MKYTDTQIDKLIQDIKYIDKDPDFSCDLYDGNFQEDFAFLEGFQDGRKGKADLAECAYEQLLEKLEDMRHGKP